MDLDLADLIGGGYEVRAAAPRLAPQPAPTKGAPLCPECRRWSSARATVGRLLRACVAVLLAAAAAGLFVAVWRDVADALARAAEQRQAEGARCARLAAENGCGARWLAPYLEEACARWEACARRAPEPRALPAVADVLADALNRFFSKLELKSLLALAILSTFTLATINRI